MEEELLDDEILKKAAELREVILNSEDYKKYLQYKKELEDIPELYEKTNEFREKNFQLQITGQSANEELVNQLLMEYGDLLKNIKVSAFMNAELLLCRKLNTMNQILMKDIDLDLRFL